MFPAYMYKILVEQIRSYLLSYLYPKLLKGNPVSQRIANLKDHVIRQSSSFGKWKEIQYLFAYIFVSGILFDFQLPQRMRQVPDTKTRESCLAMNSGIKNNGKENSH